MPIILAKGIVQAIARGFKLNTAFKLLNEDFFFESIDVGDTISLIGNIDEIRIAKAGINILLDGGKHSTAYAVMEKERRKLKSV